jgi:hypothetical protein
MAKPPTNEAGLNKTTALFWERGFHLSCARITQFVKSNTMTNTELNSILKNATSFLEKEYASFREVGFSATQNCFVYQFGSDLDAEKFILWKQVQGSSNRLEKQICHANLIAVREYVK